MSYCRERSAVKVEGDTREAVSLKCRAWTCPHCKDMRRAQLIAQALSGAPTTLLTLTSRRRETLTASQAAKKLAHCWRLVRLRLMRHYKLAKLPFLAVFERHQSGWPHLHILLRGPWLSQRLISTWMAELDDSPNVDIRAIGRVHKVAAYVAKYIGKDPHRFEFSKRYWQSQDFQQGTKTDQQGRRYRDGSWAVWTSTLRVLADDWRQKSYDVTWIGADRLKAILHPTWQGAAARRLAEE